MSRVVLLRFLRVLFTSCVAFSARVSHQRASSHLLIAGSCAPPRPRKAQSYVRYLQTNISGEKTGETFYSRQVSNLCPAPGRQRHRFMRHSYLLHSPCFVTAEDQQ